MDSNTHSKLTQTIGLIPSVLFVKYFLHLDSNLQTVESLINYNIGRALFSWHLSCEAHCYIAAADGVDLVDANLIAKMIEFAENPREHFNVILRPDIPREIRNIENSCVKHGNVLQTIHYSLVILETSKDMVGNESAKELRGFLDLDFDDPLLIVLAAHFHLTTVRS